MSNPLPQNAVVWAEFPVSNMERAKEFYASIVGHSPVDNPHGPNPMADFQTESGTGVAGHLYPGKPAAAGTGPTIHIAIPGKVEDAMERVIAAGGQVVSPVIDIPQGRFAYCLDLDGNSIGIFENRK